MRPANVEVRDNKQESTCPEIHRQRQGAGSGALLQRLGIERLEALQKIQQQHYFLWTSPGWLKRLPFHENGVR